MKIELIKTKESDGNWYKVRVDGKSEACLKSNRSDQTEEEVLARATEIFDFIAENKGKEELIKSVEI